MSDSRSRTYTWEDPMPTAQMAQQMSGVEFLQAMVAGKIPQPPIALTLGFALFEAEFGRVVFEGTPAEYHYNPIGVVHGGFAATLLDSAMGASIHSSLALGIAYTTLDMHVNLVRAITKDTGLLRCEGKVIHGGRRVTTAEAKLTDTAGKLYAHGTTTGLIFPIAER